MPSMSDATSQVEPDSTDSTDLTGPAGFPSVSADSYRAVMRHWPSGVTVITMPTADGPHGMTASAFTSVSVDPPMILIVVDRRWRSHAMIEAAGAFCVNILSAEQRDVSDRFAGRHGDLPDRFAGVPTTTAVTGSPCLVEAIGYLDCVVMQTHTAGDHTVFIGRVVAGHVGDVAEPLLFHNTRYRRLGMISGDELG
jgi:flavin reductase (DIM6/NTAB) family NADH-FMN oxidoreductase RutF